MIKLRVPRPTGLQLGLFPAVWLLVGFASGTATLLGPVRWLTDVARQSGWSDASEDLLVRGVILLYVALSFVLALALTVMASRSRRVGVAVAGLCLAAAGASLWLWMTPAVVNGLVATEVSSVARFTFGPYPDRARLEALRDEGYTGVVTLLHPAVVPFEPSLLARERALADEVGIELIHVPMLPWVSGNETSLARIRELVESGTGRYYVHCYLGRDRVGLVRSLVERLSGDGPRVAEAVERIRAGSAFAAGRFERGEIFELAEGVYMTPYPTEEEFVAYVLSGNIAQVLSLLDPENPDDVQWIDKEIELLGEHLLPLESVPVPQHPFSPERALAAARSAARLPRPLLVHGFRTDGSVTSAFRWSYRSGLPSVAVGAFRKPLEAGMATVVTPHVVVGPRPGHRELGGRLHAAGVRAVLWTGEADAADALDVRRTAEAEADLEWLDLETLDGDLLDRLEAGGPWYVYGPLSADVVDRVRSRWGIEGGTVAAQAAGQGGGG